MAAAKGTRPPNAGKGREKGVPNRATTEFRDTVRQLLEDNRENVSIWLKRVAAKNPGKALDVLGNLAEFAAPKRKCSNTPACRIPRYSRLPSAPIGRACWCTSR